MRLFPKLSSGAITQYPSTRELEQRTRIIQYTDGTEQRISRKAGHLRRWFIHLDQLSEAESDNVLTFFSQCRGRAEEFDFKDPWSGSVIPHCRFEQDDLTMEFTGNDGARTTLIIRSGE
jgi:hypothetical protein